MKGALALALVLGVWAGRSDGARAFRATMTAEQKDGGAVIAPFDGADPAGNENVEVGSPPPRRTHGRGAAVTGGQGLR